MARSRAGGPAFAGTLRRFALLLALGATAPESCGAATAHADPSSADPREAMSALPNRIREDSLLFARGLPAQRFDSLMIAVARDLKTARRVKSSGGTCRLLRFEGVALAMAGRGLAAAPVLDEALAIGEARRDTALMLPILRWRTYVAGMLGRLDDQERLARRLITIAEAVNDLRYQAVGHNFVGWIALHRGENQLARTHLEKAVRMQRSLHNGQDEAVALTALGSALMALGENDAARRNYLHQIELARELKSQWSEAEALNDLGTLEMVVGDPAQAVHYFQAAHDYHCSKGETPDCASSLIELASAESDQGRQEVALSLGREGLAIAERHGYNLLRGGFLDVIATGEERLGRQEAAAGAWNQLLALGDTVDVGTRIDAVIGLARVRAHEGRSRDALDLVQRATLGLAPRASRSKALILEHELAWREYGCGEIDQALRRGTKIGAESDSLGLLDHVASGRDGAVAARSHGRCP